MDNVELIPLGEGWSLRVEGREVRWLTGLVPPVEVAQICQDISCRSYEDGRAVGYDDGYEDGLVEKG